MKTATKFLYKHRSYVFGFAYLTQNKVHFNPLDSEHNLFSFVRLRPGDEIIRSYDKEGVKIPNTTARIDSTLSEYVHAVIFVLNGNDSCLKDGKYRDKLQTFREHLNQEGNKDIYPSLIVTINKKYKIIEDTVNFIVNQTCKKSRLARS